MGLSKTRRLYGRHHSFRHLHRRSLVRKFDALIAKKGYSSRSSAIQDLIRDKLVEDEWEAGDRDTVGTITIVYNHHTRELEHALTEMQHKSFHQIVSALHVHLDPHNLLRVGRALGDRLAQIDGANAAYYQARTVDFLARMDKAIPQWEAQAAPLKGMRVVAHHKDHAYLFHWLGITEAANLEPKPGIPTPLQGVGRDGGKKRSDPPVGAP